MLRLGCCSPLGLVEFRLGLQSASRSGGEPEFFHSLNLDDARLMDRDLDGAELEGGDLLADPFQPEVRGALSGWGGRTGKRQRI